VEAADIELNMMTIAVAETATIEAAINFELSSGADVMLVEETEDLFRYSYSFSATLTLAVHTEHIATISANLLTAMQAVNSGRYTYLH